LSQTTNTQRELRDIEKDFSIAVLSISPHSLVLDAFVDCLLQISDGPERREKRERAEKHDRDANIKKMTDRLKLLRFEHTHTELQKELKLQG
jgi:hypothetical protein